MERSVKMDVAHEGESMALNLRSYVAKKELFLSAIPSDADVHVTIKCSIRDIYRDHSRDNLIAVCQRETSRRTIIKRYSLNAIQSSHLRTKYNMRVLTSIFSTAFYA